MDIERARALARLVGRLDQAPVALCAVDDTVVFANDAFASMLGALSGADLVGDAIVDLFGPACRRDVTAAIRSMRRNLDGFTAGWVNGRFMSMAFQFDADSGEYMFSARDMTNERELLDEVRIRSNTDPLTLLPSRNILADELARHLATGRQIPLVALDLDNFKLVNDTLGHAAGDELLRQVATRLVSAIGPRNMVSRIGGDEFVILLREHGSLDGVGQVARELLQLLREPFVVESRRVHTTASIGVAVGSSATHSSADLLREADTAAYSAKRAGRDRYELYTEALRDEARSRLLLEDDLRVGLTTGQFSAAVQGIFDTETLELTGYKALARWDHPTRGVLLPDAFLDVAEECRLLSRIGDVVWSDAGARMAGPGFIEAPSTLSINLAPIELDRADAVEVIVAKLERAGLTASSVILEITERALLTDDPVLLGRLE